MQVSSDDAALGPSTGHMDASELGGCLHLAVTDEAEGLNNGGCTITSCPPMHCDFLI